jgi:hypothetical protein
MVPVRPVLPSRSRRLTRVCGPAVGPQHAGPPHHDLAAQRLHDDGRQLLGVGHRRLQAHVGGERGERSALEPSAGVDRRPSMRLKGGRACTPHTLLCCSCPAAHPLLWLTLSARRLSLWKSRPPHDRSMRAATMPALSIASSTGTLWLLGPSAAISLVPA